MPGTRRTPAVEPPVPRVTRGRGAVPPVVRPQAPPPDIQPLDIQEPPARVIPAPNNKKKKVTVAELAKTVAVVQQSAVANEFRIGQLDVAVSEVRKTTHGLDNKVDRMMDMIATLSNTMSRPSSSQAAGQDSDTDVRPGANNTRQKETEAGSIPPPAELRRMENREGAVDRLVAREDYRPSAAYGKTRETHESGIMKPYMYVDKEGCETAKQKLDVRHTLSPLEYINASLLLWNDPSAYDPEDSQPIIDHITEVSTDALVRPWSSVRRWSDFVWDSVDKGRCVWADTAFIRDARIRISYTNGAPSTSSSNGGNYGRGGSGYHNDLTSVICRDFNNISGCKFSSSHDAGSLRYIHSCAFCDSVGRRSSHSIQNCRLKNDPSAGQGTSRGHGDNNGWKGGRHGTGGSTPYHRPGQHSSQQGPKN